MNQGPLEHSFDPDATIAAEMDSSIPTDIEMPKEIGPYKIIRRLGEGGMGEVFLAAQTEPINRLVALKVVKRGMDTKAIVARFGTERQALALMNHPSIARVFDAGSTEHGRPYFAMEYVEGIPIKEFCDKRGLGTKERLELTIQVCAAVQHAHQKAIIHRDLKPSNILVTEIDDQPTPKVIDFGVARATDQRHMKASMSTQLGSVIGTPAYMSPEQTDPTNTDIDTRTDIYSLGVVLYELLVGMTPFDTSAVYSAGIESVMKFVREQEAPRPSKRICESIEYTRTTVLAQSIGVKKLARELQGDLDWILLKALAKDRKRRYQTAQDFALDIRFFLDDKPVTASPPSISYTLQKFARRHRTGVAACLAIVTMLLAFAVTASFQARSIGRERDRAEQEVAKADAINGFLQSMLIASDPWQEGEIDHTVVEALGKVTVDIDATLSGQPLIEAEMRALVGKTYIALQKLTLAEEQIHQGLAMRKEILGPDHPDVARSFNSLTQIERLNADNDKAIDAAKEMVRIYKLGEDPYSEMTMNSYARLAQNLAIGRHFAAADSILNIMDSQLSPELENFHSMQAGIYHQRARITNAGPKNFALGDSLGKVAIGILEEHSPNSPTLGVYYNDIAVNLMAGVRDLDQAAVYFKKAMTTYSRALGEDHPEYALALENLGNIAYLQQRYDVCLANLERVLNIRVRNLGADHPIAMRTMMNMGAVASGTGNYDHAIEIYDKILPLLVVVNGELHFDTATGLRNQGYAYHGAGRLVEAEAVLNRSADLFEELQGPNRSNEARSLDKLAEIKIDQGKWAAAEALMIKSFPVLEETYGADHRRTVQSAAKFVRIYEALSLPEKADIYRLYAVEK